MPFQQGFGHIQPVLTQGQRGAQKDRIARGSVQAVGKIRRGHRPVYAASAQHWQTT
jgi:hypothetical protein